MALFINLLLLGTFLVSLSGADYVLQLELRSFSNPQHTLAGGACCGLANTQPNCRQQCNVAFVFCWKDYQSTSTSIDARYCKARGSTSVYSNGDFIQFPLGPLPSTSTTPPINPLTIAGHVWPGGMQLFIRSVHYNGSDRALIDHFRLQESLNPGTTTEFRTYTGVRNSNTNIVARFSLTCTQSYYQLNCSVYCSPQDSDDMGHYVCAPLTGEKQCLPGYTNPSRNCKDCLTANGCSLENGFCNEPYDCLCRTGYGGPQCLQDLDVCGHTNPCLKGTCHNVGSNNFVCECPTNYFGPKCEFYYEDNVSCNDSLCQNGGSCISGHGNSYTCSCRHGYDGVNCTDDLDVCGHDSPCRNGATCVNTGPNTYLCQCTAEYSGDICDLAKDLTTPTVVRVSDTSPSESSTADPTVSDQRDGVPALPVIVGSVLGCIVLLSVLLCILVCVKKRECLLNKRKVRQDPDTSHVYTTVRSRSLSSSNQPASSSPDSNQISDTSTEVQQEFTNPLYSETDHYSSIVDYPQRRDSCSQLSSSHYSNPIELSHANRNYQSVDQQTKSVTDEKSSEQEASPYYAVVRDRHVSFHSTSTSASPSTPTRNSLQLAPHGLTTPEDAYSEPVDSLIAAKQAHFYHVLENGADSNVADSNVAEMKAESLPPLYMVLEEPGGPVNVPVSTEYAEASELSRHPQPKKSNTAPVLPDYECLYT